MESGTKPYSSLSLLSERRSCLRYALETDEISFSTRLGQIRGEVLNLCPGGMAVHCAASFEPASTVRFRWELPQPSEPDEIEGGVIRADPEHDEFSVEFSNRVEAEGVVIWADKIRSRIGIKFQNLNEDVERSICQWALRHASPAPLIEPPPRHEQQPQSSELGGGSKYPRRTSLSDAVVITVPHRKEAIYPEYLNRMPAAPPEAKKGGGWFHIALMVILMSLAFLGGAAYWGAQSHGENAGGSSATGIGGVPILRLAGSNSIGVKLAPALAQAFLKQLGAKDIRLLPESKQDEISVEAFLPSLLPGGGKQVLIQIAAHGSTTAFDDLLNASSDIGMTSRRIKPDELRKLSSLGDLSSATSEHVLGLDGIVVIVSPSNPVQTLTGDQLAGIFSGTLTDWSQVGGQHGAINIYAPDNNSGAYDTFRTVVLGNKKMAVTAKRLEDSRALSYAVANDRNAIGLVGLPCVQSAKALAIAERGVVPFQPNRLTVGTEDYLLSRRLYLYTPANTKNQYVQKFVDFALSKAGQEIVGDIGFIAQNVTSERDVISPSAPPEYRRLTESAARLSLDFRFLPGLSALDSKALADLDRVVGFIADAGYSGNDVMLLGFTDNTGDTHGNYAISQNRARLVAEAFAQRGLKPALVKGFGPSLPVGSNDTDAGRERNRRVEIWIKQAQCVAPRGSR